VSTSFGSHALPVAAASRIAFAWVALTRGPRIALARVPLTRLALAGSTLTALARRIVLSSALTALAWLTALTWIALTTTGVALALTLIVTHCDFSFLGLSEAR
jgi:hypothetical protein